MNVAHFLASSADRHSTRPAVTDVRSGRCLRYGDLGRETERVAAFLLAHGVGPGLRIGLMAPNGLAYLPASFGLLATGACLIPLASTLTPAERAQIVSEVELNGYLASPDAAPLPEAASRAVVPDGECQGFGFQWIDHDAHGPADFEHINAAFIRFTSGTTASSKGVVLSHEATAARIEAADRVLRLSEGDRILWVLPLAYHFAVTIVAYVRAGAHILMCPDTLPAALVDAIRRLQPSVLYASPLHFQRMGNLSASVPLTGVRLCLSTSAPITPAVCERFQNTYGVAVGQAYGIIEAGLPCINLRAAGLPAASVGHPVPGYEVAIFADDGQPVRRGELGEIAVRGGGLFAAYYSPWQLSEQVTREGWFLTGDVGWFDESGALYLKGRKKAVIFMAGLKFFPEEVEECINRFPGVKESRVFTRAHRHLAEVPCAEVVLESADCDLAVLKAHCTSFLSSFKVPWEFRIVDAVPRSPGGKILRRPAPDAPAAVSGEVR